MNQFRFNVEIKEVEKVNSLFSRCKIVICYDDLNRNNSIIPRNVIENNLHTLYGCPIVGEYSKEKEDFLDHGGKVELNKDGELEYVPTTIPYGYVPESSDVKWEFIDGKDYLTCTGYLWSDRYPEVLESLEKNALPQSMEISNVIGEFNDKKQFVVSSFNFSGLCILGVSVEPCFESASIHLFSENKEEFNHQFDLMVKELESSLKKEDSKNINFTSENQDNSLEFNNIENKENDVVKKKSEIATNFSLTVMQLYDEMNRVMQECTFIGENWWGEKCEMSRYYMRDFDESFVYAVDKMNDYIDVKLSYSKEGDNINIDFDSPVRVKYVPTDWEGVAPIDGSEEIEPEEEFTINYVKEIHEQAQAQVKEKIEEFTASINEKEDSVIAMAEKVQDLETKFNAQLEIVAEKEESIKLLDAEVQKFKKQEDEEQVDSLLKEFTHLISEEEKIDLRGKREQFAKFEEFQKEVKSFVCDRVVAKSKETNPNYISMALVDNHEPDEERKTKTLWEKLKENK